MANRIELHELLCEVLKSRSVYFQPPEDIKIKYPAIIYSLKSIDDRYADNDAYLQHRVYDVTLIDYDPDSEYIDRIKKLKHCRFDRYFVSDNLNHFAFIIKF